jgi:iron-sulfur cluster repair protein YtfE (RIC family)
VALQELDAFELDLHAHVHLENNLLFPKARALAALALA